MLALPGAVVVDRAALELADVDVVEQRLLAERHVAAAERGAKRRLRPAEARVHGEVEREVRDLEPEPRGLLVPLLGQRHLERRIAVHAPLDVQLRLRVPREQEDAHASAEGAAAPGPVCAHSRSSYQCVSRSASATPGSVCSRVEDVVLEVAADRDVGERDGCRCDERLRRAAAPRRRV